MGISFDNPNFIPSPIPPEMELESKKYSEQRGSPPSTVIEIDSVVIVIKQKSNGIHAFLNMVSSALLGLILAQQFLAFSRDNLSINIGWMWLIYFIYSSIAGISKNLALLEFSKFLSVLFIWMNCSIIYSLPIEKMDFQICETDSEDKAKQVIWMMIAVLTQPLLVAVYFLAAIIGFSIEINARLKEVNKEDIKKMLTKAVYFYIKANKEEV